MPPGDWAALYVAAVGAAMFALGWWGGHSGLAYRARRAWDDYEDDLAALDQDPAPLVEADLTLAASLPSALPGLDYVPDPERIQTVPGFDGAGDYDDQYRAVRAHAAERSAWAGHIIDRIWEGINREQDSAATA